MFWQRTSLDTEEVWILNQIAALTLSPQGGSKFPFPEAPPLLPAPRGLALEPQAECWQSSVPPPLPAPGGAPGPPGDPALLPGREISVPDGRSAPQEGQRRPGGVRPENFLIPPFPGPRALGPQKPMENGPRGGCDPLAQRETAPENYQN